MSLEIKDFSPYSEMSEGEFYEYFKDKCNVKTSIKAIYRTEKKKYYKSVRKIKTVNKQRKKTKSDTTTD